MNWSDISELRAALDDALGSYNWKEAKALCQQLIRDTQRQTLPCPEQDAIAVLDALRKRRRFELAGPVAEAFIVSGRNSAAIRRRYAQTLIEQGTLAAAELVLQALTTESMNATNEVAEAHGLLGRIYKERYLACGSPKTTHRRSLFERALAEYLQVYRVDPARYYWHGINAVALLRRGQSDGLSMLQRPDARMLARKILQLKSLRRASGSSDAFDLATRLEALIALEKTSAAEEAALRYSCHPGANAFEVGSTLRQLEEVWRLNDQKPPGKTILPVLRAAKLRREAGWANLTGRRGAATELESVVAARTTLQKGFSLAKTMTLRWYEMGLKRAESVARVESRDGRGVGTAWLVDKDVFFPGQQGVLLVTNYHVVNNKGNDNALFPDQAIANFQMLHRRIPIKAVFWSSPLEHLDASFLEINDEGEALSARPMPIFSREVRLTVPAPRMYSMGHPDGRDLEFGLYDNKLLACNDRLLHYRTPTERGSSGSPIFEDKAWEVVALHHAGGLLERLDGTPPPYEANEGIAIKAILRTTRSSAGSGTFGRKYP